MRNHATITQIFTVGHSTHSFKTFLHLLKIVDITAIADVRSSPTSRWFPHFNKNELQSLLSQHQIAYSFLGKELGGRPKLQSLFEDGIANYEAMARTKLFCEGIERVLRGSQKYRIALMCAEHDPLDCHRCLMVARELQTRNLKVTHILGNGSVEEQGATEARLLKLEEKSLNDLFIPKEERIALAYRNRSRKVAFSTNDRSEIRNRKAVG